MNTGTEVTAEMIRLAYLEDRLHTVDRALRYMGSVTEAELVCTLHYTDARQHLKDNPNMLMYALAQEIWTSQRDPDYHVPFGTWKIAQQICEAAGLPY